MTNSNKASAARNGALGQEPVASTRDVAPSRAAAGCSMERNPACINNANAAHEG
jgi:hypothetical protein